MYPARVLDFKGDKSFSIRDSSTAQRSRGGESLAIYRDLALADVSGEYEQAMLIGSYRSFPCVAPIGCPGNGRQRLSEP